MALTTKKFHELLSKHPDFYLTGNAPEYHDFRHKESSIGVCSNNVRYSMWWLAEYVLQDFDATDEIVGDHYSINI